MMSDTKMINFDSSDWNSIRDTIEKINDFGSMQTGKTEDGLNILFDVCKNGNGDDCLVTYINQTNGWCRKNIYDPSDYTIEETYKRMV